MSRDQLRLRGREIAKDLAQSEPQDLIPGFGDFKAEVVFASIWDRPNLPKPDRALCTLAALSVLQRHAALEANVGGLQ